MRMFRVEKSNTSRLEILRQNAIKILGSLERVLRNLKDKSIDDIEKVKASNQFLNLLKSNNFKLTTTQLVSVLNLPPNYVNELLKNIKGLKAKKLTKPARYAIYYPDEYVYYFGDSITNVLKIVHEVINRLKEINS
ncbi:MAG: hypothetical protein QXG91_03590 [Candidatus Aenigmatarchaeota archaeon]